MSPTPLTENGTLASLLDEVAALLEAQHANPFRVRAYREGATALRELDEEVRSIHARGGHEALVDLPHIGDSLARSIETWLSTGVLGIRQRLRGEDSAERVIGTLGGVGPKLAHRIVHDLHVGSLEDLEVAAHDGRLEALPGFGAKKVREIREQLETRLRHRRGQAGGGGDGATPEPPRVRRSPAPSVEEILDVDREYAERVADDSLPRIAPRRFNPEGHAWLPILHTLRDGGHYTALFSNTARAHELGKTDDWVVVHLDEPGREAQWTVVTEWRGDLEGERVVRGREEECRELLARGRRTPEPGDSVEGAGRRG